MAGAKAAVSDLIISGGGEQDRAAIVEGSAEQLERLVDFIADNLAASSRRVYRRRYAQWRHYAAQNQVDIFDLSLENVAACLNQSELAGVTRRSWKAHMLRVLRLMICTGSGADAYHFGAEQRRALA